MSPRPAHPPPWGTEVSHMRDLGAALLERGGRPSGEINEARSADRAWAPIHLPTELQSIPEFHFRDLSGPAW
eukprot:4416652-Alexandrium_andersonii.AAC.1